MMENMTRIPIFLATDDAYAPMAGVMMASVADNTRAFVEFHVIDTGISEENRALLALVARERDNMSVDFTGFYFNDMSVFSAIGPGHISTTPFAKFFIPWIRPLIDRAIFIDSDAFAIGDIEELWREDLDGFAIGAVPDPMHFGPADPLKSKVYEAIELSQDHEYFNSGVLLLDCKKLRDEDMVNAFINISALYPKKYYYDQCVLNKAFGVNNYKNLDWKYNVFATFEDRYAPETLDRARGEAVIVHLMGKDKPWNCRDSKFWCGQWAYHLWWQAAGKTLLHHKILFDFIDTMAGRAVKKRAQRKISKRLARALCFLIPGRAARREFWRKYTERPKRKINKNNIAVWREIPTPPFARAGF